jgi:hypothetical protein
MPAEAEIETEESEEETEATVDGGLSRLTLPGTVEAEDELAAPRRRDEHG